MIARSLPRAVCTCAFAALLGFAATPSAHADDATKRQKIQEYFKLIQIDRSMQQVMSRQIDQAQQLVRGMFPGAKFTPEQQKDMDDFLKRVLAISQESLSWQKLQPEFVDMYASTYSEPEMDGILAFYRSPVGQEMVAKQPEILNKSQALTQEHMKEIQPKLRDAIMQFGQQMQQKYPNGTAK